MDTNTNTGTIKVKHLSHVSGHRQDARGQSLATEVTQNTNRSVVLKYLTASIIEKIE